MNLSYFLNKKINLAILTLLLLSISFVSAWTGPPGAPPACPAGSVGCAELLDVNKDQSIGGIKTFTGTAIFNNPIIIGAPTSSSHAATRGYVDSVSGAIPLGRTSGDTGTGYLLYAGTTRTPGRLYGGTTAPSGTIRLNYDGYLYATRLYDGGTRVAISTRNIGTGDGLSGGGDLTANRTLSVDSTVIRTSGDQTIGGTKTFSSPVVVAAPTGPTHATTKEYVDSAIITGITGSPTNLGYIAAATTGTITSSTGTSATIPAATTTLAGLMTNTDKTKLDGIAAGAQVNVPTNLGIIAGTTAGPIITSSTGTNATLPIASETASGVVTTGNQTWAGTKTFSSPVVVATPTGPTHATTKEYVDSVSGAIPLGRTSGDTGTGYLLYAGTTRTAGRLYGGTTAPSGTTRLNYDGYLYATRLYDGGTRVAISTRNIGTGDGLSGGGDLTANRTLTVDSTVIRTSGDQTIGGTKTFSSPVVVAAPTGPTHAATKGYVDSTIGEAIAGTTQGTVTSVGTGDGLTGGPITSSGTISVDSTVVRTTGNQTIGGTKTFSSAVVLSTAGTATNHAVRADRTISTTNGITGGGNLTANRTLSLDSTVVRTTGDQTIAGTKTFTGSIVATANPVAVGAPIADNHAATRGYVNSAVAGSASKWITSGTNIYNANSGNVGIGTSSPGYKLTINGSIGTPDTNNPYLVLDSSSSGGDNAEQSAQISLGESGRGSASLHLAYTGDGYSYIGMGALTNNIPTYYAMRMHYQNNNVYFPGSLSVVGTATVATPTSGSHAATKQYVDSAITDIGIGGYVPTSRTISTTNGITGGGDLTANRTLSLDSTVVRTTGNQTIGGTKTFSSAVVLSTAGTATNHAVRADRTISTTNGITGGGNLTANRTLSLDSTVVRTTGDQTLAGTKTFSSPVVVATPTGSTHAATKAYVDSMFSGSGPWTLSGSNVYVTNTAYNVGIGTSSPAAKLNISESAGTVHGAAQGSFIIDHENSGGASSIVFRSKKNRGSDYGYIQYQDDATIGGTGESARLFIGTSNDYDDHIVLQPAGNVGIGTTSPSYKLDVSGTGRFTSTVVVGEPTGPTHAATKGYVDSAIVNIGIGGYVPTSRTISTTNGITGGGDLTANRTLSLDSTVIRTTGNQTIGGTKTFSSAVVLSTAGTATTHAVRADRTISTTNGITGGGNLTTNRTLSLDSTVVRTTGDQTIAGTKTFTGSIVATANPVAVGAPLADNHAATRGYVNSTVAGSASKWITSGTNIYNANSGNVGIGTTTPLGLLHISKGAGSNGVAEVYIEADTDNTVESSHPRLILKQDGGIVVGRLQLEDNYLLLQNDYADSLRFGTGGTTKMTILSGGNVGIGTTSPSYKLDVSGTGRFTSTVEVGTPTSGSHAATKAYVDSAITDIGIGGYVPTSRTISTTNGITGGGDLSANRTLSLDSTVVRTTGNQTLGGTKTFSSAVVLSTAGTATNHAVRADRTISTTNGITGGGNLTANRTLSLDSTVVRTTGNQTLGGTKTFSSPVVVAAPTGPTHAATKGYVDSTIGEAIAGTTQGTVTSVGTGDGLTGGPITSSGTISVDSTVVRTTGNQTIGGTKTFSSAVVLSTAGTATNHAVRADRTISTTNGITGGGNLTANRTLSLDSTVVRTTGDQTIAGTKTFTGSIVATANPVAVGAPIADNHAATRGYVNSAVAGSASKWITSGTNIYNANSGNVGIGTSSPTEKLEVNGKLKIGNNTISGENITFDGSTSAGMRLTNAYGYINLTPLNTGWAHIYTDRPRFIFNTEVQIIGGILNAYNNTDLRLGTSSGAEKVRIKADTGNVGIGTTSPSYKLDVSGTGRFTSTVEVGAPTGPNHAATKQYVDSAITDIGIGGYVPTSRTISTTNGITGGGDLTANRTLSLDSTVVRTTGNQTLAGTKTFSSPVVVATPTGSTHATTKAYVDSMFSGSGPWTLSGSNVYVTNTAHNVGIGTTAPGYKLDVRGDVSINANTSGPAMSPIFTAGNTGKSYLHFPAISGSNDPGFIMHETSALTADSNKGVIHISPTDDNDNVGDYVTIHGTNDPETIRLYTGGNIYTTGILQIAGTSNSYLMGNVGIGTTTPGYKLDVNGTGRFTSTVEVGAPTGPNHAATKQYVDSAITDIGIGGYVPTSRTISTTNGITGGGDLSANRILSLDSTVLRTSGNQTRTSGLLVLEDSTFANQLRISRTGGSNYSVIQYYSNGVEVGKAGFTGSGEFLIRNGTSGSDNWKITNGSLTIGSVPWGRLTGVPSSLSNTVNLTGDQTIAGTKTFSSPVVVATPTSSTHATTKAYVDSAAQSSLYLISSDTRSDNIEPQNHGRSVRADFRSNSTDGLSDGGSYHGVISFRPYGSATDWTGGPMHQLGFTQNQNLWMRTSTGSSSWSAWKQINHIGTNLGITAGTTAGPIITSSTGTNATLPTASATASGVVTTGNQTWAGIKTFSSPVVVATPTSGSHAATKAYVDSAITDIGIGGYVPTSRTISTTNGITGGGDLTANRTLSLDSTVVRTTGNQTIGGTKTFSSAVVLSTAGTATNHAVRADRTISTTNGITGGGNLTANRTLSLDSTVIRTTGNQTLGGTKTFSSPVVVATPTGSTHATTKGYVDSAVGTTTTSFSVTAGNWYTIATNPGNRAYATFEVWDTTSGRHGSMQFNAGVSYGNQQATITMLGKSWYGSGGIFNNIRIRGTGTYDTHYLQIYATANGTLFVRMHNNIQSSGWTLVSGTPTGAPGSSTFAEIVPNNSSGISTNRSGYIGGNLGVGQASPSYKLDVSGTGRFTGTVTVGVPTSGSHAATKAYVDSAIVNIGIGGYVPTSRTISTTNGITGGGDLTANRTLSLDSTVVRTTGNQTIGGTKTFSSTISGSITGNAGTVGGLSVHAGRNNEANKVVRTDGSGYIQAGWINTTSGNNGTTAPGRIYASNDAYIRYYTPANFATVMNTWLVRTSGDQTIAGVKTFSSVIRGPNGTAAAPAFTFSADTNTGIYSGGTDILRFSTAGADRLTILANGNVGIGTTSPTQKLEVNGDVIANAYYYLSDIRKKENVTNIENSLSKILQLQGISYNLKGEEDKRMGFSAQELQKVYPELVKEGSDGYLSIDGTGLIAPLVESIKEQQKKIEELEEKINILMQKQ